MKNKKLTFEISGVELERIQEKAFADKYNLYVNED